LFEGAIAAGRSLDPDQINIIYEVEQHLLVITTETNHPLRILAAKLKNVLDATGNVRSTVNQISEKDQLVSGFITRQQPDKAMELRAAAVNVANNKGFHKCFVSFWEKEK
jgi:hypothetical protein